jgi:hypothetical protein
MNSVSNLLLVIKRDFSHLKFLAGEDFHWSPKDNTIYYSTHQKNAKHGVWALLHEVAHAQLGHQDFNNDFDLIKIESKTWQEAVKIGKKYKVKIDKDHIQDCLDTYRDWLHNRARCPKCEVISLQRDDHLYQCFNCNTVWKISNHLNTANKRVIKK